MSRIYKFALYDRNTGERITDAGGSFVVVTKDAYAKVALTDADGATVSQPVSFTNGGAEFYTADATTEVDIYGVAPGGESFHVTLQDGHDSVVKVDTDARFFVHMIPFDIDDADTSDNTEEDSGFDEIADVLYLPTPYVIVGTADSGETIDVGRDSTDSGDADGFLDGASVGTAGMVKGTLTNGSATLGVDFSVQDSANGGDLVPEGHVSTEKSITFTLSDGTDTGAGLICLPYMR